MKFNGLFIETELPKPLEKEELYNYFEQMKLGDRTARDEIINHNIRLVINEVMRKFSNTAYDLNELVSIGLVGLVKSVDTFDTSKGLQFATYSTRCINNEILMFMRKGKKYINDTSLDQPIGKDKEGKELKVEDILSDMNSDFVSKYEDNESYKVIREVVEQLPERDKNIVIKHFGFIDNQPMTQKAIAEELGICQAQVSRIIKRVLKKVSVKLETLGIIEVSRKDQEVPRKDQNVRKEKTNQGEKGMSKRLQTIYEYFNKYEREQVDEMLSKLDAEEKALITLRYGEDLDNPITSKEWNKKTTNQYYGRLLPKMKKLLADPNYVFRARKTKKVKEINSSEEIDTKNTQIPKLENQIQENTIPEIISDDTSEKTVMSKEDYIRMLELIKTSNFEQMLKVLTPKEAIIVCLKLGYVDDKYFTTESISKFLGIDSDEVIESTKKVLLLYKDSINEFIDKAVKYTTDQQNENVLVKKSK